VTTDGLHFTNLHSFSAMDTNGDNNDGANPVAGLVLSNDVLYGTAPRGGAAGDGSVFALPTDGSGFTNLHSFTYGTDGANPMAPLFLTNGLLYGTAAYGGYDGTIFAIGVDGSNFTTVYSFSGRGDGATPMGGLVGDRVFVPLANGGIDFAGAVFSMNLDGTGMVGTSLAGGASGSYPVGQVALLGNGTVAVAAQTGGAANNGAILAVTQGPELAATLESSGGNVTIPEGGSGTIDAPLNTLFDYSFVLNSNINPNSINVALGPLPNGLNSPSMNVSTGVWSITGDFTQSGVYPVTLEVQDGAFAYFYTLNIDICNPPTITNIVAANTNVLLNPGSQIIITGTGLSSATQVLFNYPFYGASNGIPGTNLVINSDNQITVAVPADAATGPIGVFTSCGYAVTTPSLIIGSMPVITLSSPALAPGVFSFNLNGPMGTYEIWTSTDLIHWSLAETILMEEAGDPSVVRPGVSSLYALALLIAWKGEYLEQ
jgi:uncharacterized repeat protein (TIGR03803 family)